MKMDTKTALRVVMTLSACAAMGVGGVGCGGSSGGSGGSKGPSATYDDEGVLKSQATVESAEQIAAAMSAAFAWLDDPEALLPLPGGVFSAAAAEALARPGTSWRGRSERPKRPADRSVESATVRPASGSQTVDCDAGQIKIDEDYRGSGNWDSGSERYTLTMKFEDCQIGSVTYNGSLKVKDLESWSMDAWKWEGEMSVNVAGRQADAVVFALNGSMTYEGEEIEGTSKDIIKERGHIPLLEIRAGGEYVALQDGRFRYDGEYDWDTGNEKGEETFSARIASSALGGYLNFTTPKALVWDDAISRDCPVAGIERLAGAGNTKFEIWHGADTGIGGVAVAVVVNDSPADSFASCSQFEQAYWVL